MEIILTHENADFDAVASLLAAHKLNPDALPVLPERLNQNVARFMTLYQNGLPFARAEDVQPEKVKRITLVDTQRLPKLRGLPDDAQLHIIDHHPLTRELEVNQTFSGDTVGAATTLLVEQIQSVAITLNSLEATLLELGIYEDTGSLSYGTTTPRDHRAAAWLLEQKATLDNVRQFLTPPLNDEQQALFEKLFQSAENRSFEGYIVTVCATEIGQYVSEISSVAHRLRDTLDSAILFVLVQMPESLQLVCRATVDALDMGEVARSLGGGGHSRAAAASIHDLSLDEAQKKVWEAVYQHIQPLTHVSDLMSYGVHTVEARQHINDVVRKLRRIGHEGYPVVENGAIVGLLTRRDLDRAAEHGLDVTIREIMIAGNVTLQPSDSISTLEQRIVESGWGQIPVLDETGKLIGIVTRTDLIKHWARVHPPTISDSPTLSVNQIEAILGSDVSKLIQTIAAQDQADNTTLYLVGGVVRDLLLNRTNLDIDFVVETSAIDFAESLAKRLGGKVSSFRPFGTAKWTLDDAAAASLSVDLTKLPEHIDFATARNEFYEHPTALPTVYNSSIKLDLARRDFTINTLALQLSPASAAGRILDFYGGLHDLAAGLIRVLHSLSFVDDPTRVLRAVRFERRLGFQIEPRTAQLIDVAKPMLGRITGERLRNELSLLLKEAEPEKGLRELETRGVLTAIHPAFTLTERFEPTFQAARSPVRPWPTAPFDIVDLYWHLLTTGIPIDSLAALSERLLFAQSLAQSMLATRKLVDLEGKLTDPAMKPSRITARLEGMPELVLLAGWMIMENTVAREAIRRYWVEWQHVHPTTDGNTLRERGLKPGPCYRLILERLRNARLDGEIANDTDEQQLVDSLIREGICDDRT